MPAAVPAIPGLLSVFNALPGAHLLLSPDLIMEAASDARLTATFTKRENLLGRYLFDVFPDNPQAPEAQGVHNLRASLAQVLATGQPHEMPPQRYDIPDPDNPGQFIERHWTPTNTPVLDAQGRVIYLIHTVTDVTDAVKNEARLRESQAAEKAARAEAEAQRQRFYDVLMQLPAQVATYHGPDHIFTFVNQHFSALVASQELLGRPVREAAQGAVESEVFAQLDRVYATGEPMQLRELKVTLDGHDSAQTEPLFINAFYLPLRDAQDRIHGVLDFSYDVTEQVRARQQLEKLNHTLEARVQARTQEVLVAARHQVQERETFYQVFEQTPAAICIQRGPEHRYEYINAAYQAFFPGREFIGRAVAEVLPETVDSGVVALLDRVYETGETYFGQELPLLIAQPVGPPKQMYFTFTYQAFRENGEIVGISTFAYDVAEQVRARQERETRQRQLQQVFEQAPVAVCVFRGPEYVLDVVNPSMVEMLGRPLPELLGRPFFVAMPELVDQGLRELLDGVRLTGKPFVAQEQEIRLRRHGPNGTGFFNFVYQPLRDERGQVAAITYVAIEVTEQVQSRERVQELNEELAVMNQELAAINEEMQATNEELNESNAQLTRTNVDLDNFIYTASHDLKTPISNIEGLLHALQEQLPPTAQQTEPVEFILTMMQGAVDRFKQTIGHLTDISKLQQEHAHPIELVNLAAVVENVRLDLLPLLEETGAHLEVAVAGCPAVAFSTKNLRSVVYNLLSNALKYRHPDRAPRVQVTCQPASGALLLRVADNGLGLDETQQAKLFGMFRRLHTHVEGSGIGLYMVKKMVENVGGKIEVESQLGVGSVFTVYLPS